MIISHKTQVRQHLRSSHSWLLGILLLAASGWLTGASAGWSGYWTWNGQNWVWTWVWTSPPVSCCSASSLPASAFGSAGATGSDCCSITIFGFAEIQPASIERSGLLASDFIISSGDASNPDLVATYTGGAAIGPGILLGSMTLDDPVAFPNSAPPVDLTYRESFVDPAGAVLSETGFITSAVPEPGPLFLLAGFVLGWKVWRLAPLRSRRAVPHR